MNNLTGWSFPIEVDENSGRIKSVSNNDNIREGITLILETQRSERKNLPEFGAATNDFVFQNIDIFLENMIEERITTAIETWEPNAKGVEISVEPVYEDAKSSLIVKIEYSTEFSNERQKITRQISLNDLN